jgi:CHASE2 domain-containing sensor protein
MGTAEWIMLALLLAIGVAGSIWLRAWKQPRLFVLIGVLIMVGVGMGTEVGLILTWIDSISPAALYVVAPAVILFEAYRWRRRSRRNQP